MRLGKRQGKRNPERPVSLRRCHRLYPENGCKRGAGRRGIYGPAPGRKYAGVFTGSVLHETGEDRICIMQSGNPEKRLRAADKRRVAGEADPGSGYVSAYGGDRDGGVSGPEIGGAAAFLWLSSVYLPPICHPEN